jgi:hypothetical protein
VVLEGTKGELYDEIYDYVFSPDSKHFAYRARKGGRQCVVRDGVEVGIYDSVGAVSWAASYSPMPFGFSPDSAHLVYFAKKDGKWFAVRDGEEGKPFDYAGSELVFSPDSKHFAYVAHNGGSSFVVLDGAEGGPHSLIRRPVFSPDSKHLAYIAGKGDERLLVVDGAESSPYLRDLSGIIFTAPDKCHTLMLKKRDDGRTDVLLVEAEITE